MPAIATRTIQILCLLAPMLAWAQEQPRVYYVDGELFQQLTDRGVTVILGIKDDGRSNWLTVSVDNDSNGAVTILPSAITLYEKSPKDQELRMKSEKDLGKSIGHHVFWGQMVASVGIALSRNISTSTTSDAYGNSFRTVENTPDYEAQARWL